MKQIILLAIISVAIAFANIATSKYERAKRIAVEEADRFGISVSTDRIGETVIVKFSVSSQFPCKLDAVSVATFERSHAILSALIEPRNGVYQIQALEGYLERTRIDFFCVSGQTGPALYILDLSGLKKNA